MGVTDKLWDAITTVIRMNDKIERMAGTVKSQQERIERLTERVIRLETMLELALAQQRPPSSPDSRRLEHRNDPPKA